MITQSGALPSLQAQEAHLRASLRKGKVRIIHAHPSRPSKLSNYALESASMPRPTFRTAVAADQRFVFLPFRKSAMADQDHRRSLVALSVGKARTLARPAKCCVLRAAGPFIANNPGISCGQVRPWHSNRKGSPWLGSCGPTVSRVVGAV